MEVRRVRELKRELAASIEYLLNEFVKETGVVVEGVSVESSTLYHGFIVEPEPDPVQIFSVSIRCSL